MINSLLKSRLVPYRGTWDFYWVVQRYFQGSISGFSAWKAVNAMQAFAEMWLARDVVRSKPVVLRIEPCNVCTLRCPNCACGAKTDMRPKGMLSLADLRLVLDQVKDSVVVVRLDGMGEPTMHRKIFEMIRLIKSKGISVTMSTNFQTPACDRADEFINSGLDRLVVAVDGTTQEVYGKYRVGGVLDATVQRIKTLVEEKRIRRVHRPIVEVQFLELDHNRHQIDDMRRLVRTWKVDAFTITRADPIIKSAQKKLPAFPKRCFWLWFVLTLGWNLDYRSCTNAWSLSWPELNMRDVSIPEYWNHSRLREARRYNKNKSSEYIAREKTCKCNRCYEMLVAPMESDYFCE